MTEFDQALAATNRFKAVTERWLNEHHRARCDEELHYLAQFVFDYAKYEGRAPAGVKAELESKTDSLREKLTSGYVIVAAPLAMALPDWAAKIVMKRKKLH